MTKIMVNKKCKQYIKADRATQRSISNNIYKLANMLFAYRGSINSIFNNDSIIYDRINSEIFMYKCHGVNNIQLRILYGVRQDGEDIIIYLIDFVCKTRNNKQYINELNRKFRNLRISDLTFYNI